MIKSGKSDLARPILTREIEVGRLLIIRIWIHKMAGKNTKKNLAENH